MNFTDKLSETTDSSHQNILQQNMTTIGRKLKQKFQKIVRICIAGQESNAMVEVLQIPNLETQLKSSTQGKGFTLFDSYEL